MSFVVKWIIILSDLAETMFAIVGPFDNKQEMFDFVCGLDLDLENYLYSFARQVVWGERIIGEPRKMSELNGLISRDNAERMAREALLVD